jgi:hypothetical protein
MERASQRKLVEIDRGLFLIRYSAAEDTTRPPVIRVLLNDADDKDTSFILHPDQKDAVLWQPGAALVVRAAKPSKLTVEVAALIENGSTAASVKIEPLTQGSRLPKASPGLDLRDFKVLGHVARVGDVFVGPLEWLGGPSAPSRIEGVGIEWPAKPSELGIRYAVKLAKPHAISGQMMDLGSFAGTRGRSLPVVGMTLEMSGPGTSNCHFVVEAMFLGSPISRTVGKRVVLSGPTGGEAMVGLRISIEHADAPQVAPTPMAPSAGRIRVFRSRAKPNQASPS